MLAGKSFVWCCTVPLLVVPRVMAYAVRTRYNDHIDEGFEYFVDFICFVVLPGSLYVPLRIFR